MARVLQHAVAASLGTRLEALEEHAALDEDRLHLERVDIRAVVVLGVGDRRLEEFAYERRAFLRRDRKSTRLNSSHLVISYAVFCLKKKKNKKLHIVDYEYSIVRKARNSS